MFVNDSVMLKSSENYNFKEAQCDRVDSIHLAKDGLSDNITNLWNFLGIS